jgi:hypothetical protein
MRHHNTLLHGLLQFIPWGRFDALVDEHGSDRRVRKLNSKSQLIALIHAQLSGASSLREIEATMASQHTRLYHLGATAPKRSTLADANAERSADAFCGLFEALLAQAHPQLRRASREAIRLVDATSVGLTAQSQGWAGTSKRGCGAKLHVVLDPDAALPVHFLVTSRRVNDITPAKAMPIEPGATYVFDLGYYDFSWWSALDAQGCRFVTRLKTHTRPTLIQERRVEAGGSVIADRVIRLTNRLARNRRNPLEKPLREVHVRLDTGKVLHIVSNDLEAPARDIADLYKRRWDIELFFHAVGDGSAYLGQADPQDPPLPRHLPQRHPGTDSRGSHRLSAAAHGACGPAHGRQHPHVRQTRARQSHARQIHPSTRRTPAPADNTPRTDGDAILLNRTAVQQVPG